MTEEKGPDEPITVDSFLFMCRRVGLYRDDLEDMTIGMCLDFIDEWIAHNSDKPKTRKATQEDFDSF